MPRKSWWARLPFAVRMAVGAFALLMVIGGSVAGISAMIQDKPRVVQSAARESTVPPRVDAAPAEVAPSPPGANAGLGVQARTHRNGYAAADTSRFSDEADRTATRAPRATAGADGAAADNQHAAAPAGPDVTTRTVSEIRPIPYQTQLVRDQSLPRGSRRVQTPGVAGEQTLRYLVTYAAGQETGRRLLDATVTREPVQRVIAFGSRRGMGHEPGRGHGDQPPECSLRLTDDACVPIARSALCPADKTAAADRTKIAAPGPAEPAVAEPTKTAAKQERGLLGDDLYLVDPADVADLELDPGIICE
jgi:hypothetical protein